jgi:hypothetical protein
MRRAIGCVVCALVVAWVASPALADWYEGDGYNMHYPQLPDPEGWDVEFFRLPIGDDWQALYADPISEIHFWTSWYYDDFGYYDAIFVDIFDDAGGVPGNFLWGQMFEVYEEINPYGQGYQGFYNPPLPSWEWYNHQFYQQVNLYVTEDPFVPVVGETYWLIISVDWFTGIQSPPGWKSTLDEWGSGGVFWDFYDAEWDPLTYQTGEPMHLAFVLGPPVSPVEPQSWGQIKALFQ